jgi:hypothetical protein
MEGPISLGGSILVTTVEAADDLAHWVVEVLLGRSQPPLTEAGEARVGRVEEHAQELLDEIRERRIELVNDAKKVFTLLGQIPEIIHWNEGLKDSLHTIVLGAVEQAERFGDGTGHKKREFAMDVVIRVLQRYHFGGLPFLPIIENTFVRPLVGILIDWSVQVLNFHGVWDRTVKTVTFPSLFEGLYGVFLKFGLGVMRAYNWVRIRLYVPTKYERNIRDALREIEPDVRDLLVVLSPDHAWEVLQELATLVAEMGQVTLPYVTLVDHFLTLSAEFAALTPAERSEAVFRMLRSALLEAYADNEFAVAFLDSPLGDMLLRRLVENTTLILVKKGLLPGSEKRPLSTPVRVT